MISFYLCLGVVEWAVVVVVEGEQLFPETTLTECKYFLKRADYVNLYTKRNKGRGKLEIC